MAFILSRRSLSRLCGLHPNVSFLLAEGIKVTPIDFGVIEGVRSIETQEQYVETGVSWTLDSYHLYGLAADIAPWVGGMFRFEKEPTEKVISALAEINVAHGLGIEFGGYLWGKDWFHMQYSGMKSRYDWRKLSCVPS